MFILCTSKYYIAHVPIYYWAKCTLNVYILIRRKIIKNTEIPTCAISMENDAKKKTYR